jgi:predicted dinucleotide-binding enzyme
MVDPGLVAGEHDIFLSGNDEAAKDEVALLLQDFGWPRERIVDLGDITAARGQELYVALWIRLMNTVGSPTFNIRVTH